VNQLFFGDCLDILKKLHHEHPSGFIDLIYIDPPFNSKRNYNILFESADLKDTKAQKEAFADTWSNISYKDTLEEIKEIDLDLFKFLEGLDSIRISKSAVSYLTTMAIRIYYMHKVLINTGSFYLHCDPNMSHYLKLICDLIFDGDNFRNEIVWHYAGRRMKAPNKFNSKHDIILFYAKSSHSKIINYPTEPYTREEYLTMKKQELHKDEDGREWIWGHAGKGKSHDYRIYIDEVVDKGRAVDSVWDIPMINTSAKERLGYPTQKPEALLKRIIEASSDKGDLIADFFCGCGTTISVAQELKRKWLGADISHLAVGLIERRLIASYGKSIKNTYEIDGLPKDISSAKQLATGTAHGRLKFQDWIIETMIGGIHNPKRTADGGWDGHLTFEHAGKKEVILIEVKSGNVNVKNMREFIQVVRKQKADMGVLVCFEEQVTKPMKLAAKEEGYYRKETWGDRFDKIQILTVENLLDGEGMKFPSTQTTTVKAAEKKIEKIDYPELFK
jgi:site-specific DNA-methyltransferase (adenine-specific)